MENKKSNHHLSESLRRKLENFPEEFPTENDWQQVRDRMMSEGLLRKKSHRRRYLLLLLLIVGIVLITVPFWIKKENYADTNIVPPREKATENNGVQNQTSKGNEPLKNENVKTTNEEKTKHEVIAEKPGKAQNPSQGIAKNNTPKKNNIYSAEKNASEAVLLTNSETAKQDEQISNAGGTPVEVKSETSSERKEEKENATEDTQANEVNSEIEVTKETGNNSQAEVPATLTDTSSVTKNTPESTPASNDSALAVLPDTAKTDSTLAITTSESKHEEKNTPNGKLQLGVFVSWDSNKYHLKANSNAERTETDYIMNSDSMNGKKSAEQFTAGIRASYSVSNKLSLEAGVFYSQKRRVDAIIYTPQYSTSAGNSISDFTYHFNAKYFEIEQRIKYFIWQKKSSIYIAAGAKESFNLNQSNPDYFEHTIYSVAAIPRTERVLLKPASMGLSLVLAAGWEVPLGARSVFFFEPSYTYALDPVINNPDYIVLPVNLYRRSFSFGTGLNYKF